ncbi:hypothetical protein ABPG74_016750 [Tetrahymena malaccensis]
MENELFLDNFDMSPIHAIDTPQSQSETPVHNYRYPVKINLQSNPIALAVRRANNDYGFENDQVLKEPKYKVIKFNSSRDIQQGSIRDFSENFVSKTIPVEKTFVRINYLKNKEKEVKTVEDIVGCSTISTVNQSSNEKSQVGNPQKKQKEKTKKANLSKSISKTTITDTSKNQAQSFKKRSSISNSSKCALPSARSMSKKGGNTPSKNNSMSERKSNKKNYQTIIKTKSPSHKLVNNSSSSCCSCCKSHASPLSSSEKNMVLPSEGGQSSVYHSISQRAQSVNSKKSNQRSSFNIHFDLSSEWNHKSSILSQSGQNRTSEYLQKKFQQIFERKQEKIQIKQIQQADKVMRNELYGMFSRQSRDMRQKKLQELSMFEQMQKQLIQTVDPEKIQKVQEIVRQSIEKYSLQKQTEKEELEQRENQKKELIKKIKDYDQKVKQNNYLAIERKSKSRENSQKKEIQYKPWGIDQRKFDSKPTEVNKVKVVKKDQQIDLKVLFSKNETVNQLLKQIKIEQKKKQQDEQQSQPKKNQHSQSSNDIKQEKKIDANEFNKKMEERLQKIIEEKKSKANELKVKKQDLNQKLNKIEQVRKESMTKCKKVPFKPTQEQIEKAFNNLQEENQQNLSNQENQEIQKNQNIQVKIANEPNQKSKSKSKKSKIYSQV